MRKTQVSLPRRQLVELMQRINYGAIENLEVRNGEPVLDPIPVVLRDIALGRANGPHPAVHRRDFELKSEVVELFALFDREQDVRISLVVVQAGLPLRVRVRVTEIA